MEKISGLKLMSRVLPITFLALSSLPSLADFTDVSSSDLGNLTYTNTGDSVSTSPYGEATGNGAVTDPSTETTVGLTLYLPKNIAMAINTRQSTDWTPGGIFGASTLPVSRFAVREDHEAILNGSNTEFIIRGLVASNVDNVQLDFDSSLTLTHASGSGSGQMTVNISGFGGAGATGYTSNTALTNGGSIDTSNGLGGFRLEGDIDTASVDRTADRAGQYDGSTTITATTL
ncbi:MAG: hypothetical protein SFU25_07885 [Candidatus Caenarcaniphilales bacterium]|nr:hypothetical protein [Candidatus Caenarcaniphilales bacterium]